ncbi:MAG: fumarylacetoacetase [Acidimicrobiia bacterium]
MTGSWVDVATGSDFPLDNLPYGVFDSGKGHRIGVAIGDHVLDLYEVADRGLLPYGAALQDVDLNGFLALGRSAWHETRGRITELLAEGSTELQAAGIDALHLRSEVQLHLPFTPGDYVDFYSSIEHATNLGRMFRPDSEPLLPNWRHLPVGYHGRASTVVVSGTDIRRPHGQTKPTDGPPVEGPTNALDIELEVGFVTGPGNALGVPIDADDAGEHIFGMVLVNDWSARDIQRWEYVPLGPFLGKSFATTVSPWVVPLEALVPYMVPGPAQVPEPLPYLRTEGDWGVEIQLEVGLAAASMDTADVISRTSFDRMYWTMAQQLAHATVNGTRIRPGDLYASGTVSGSEPGTYGSLIELTWGGRDPIDLSDGSQRTYLEDGDTVTLRGWCERDGLPRIGFGECVGRIVP